MSGINRRDFMKLTAEGECRGKLAESIHFVLRLGCVDAMSIGFLEPSEIESAFRHVGA